MPTSKSTTDVPKLVLLGHGAFEDYESGEPEVFVPSGLPSLDALILGAVAGELTMLAGKPGEGKTALGMQWAIGNAQAGNATAVASLEMGKRALRNRIISGITGVPMAMLRTRQWASPKHKKLVLDAAKYLQSIPLYVDDRPGMNADKVYRTVVEWGKQGITLAVIDYIQQMSGANESRVTQVGDAVRAIKAGAKDADIPVIAISAVNRQSSIGEGRTPKLSDLRDTGDLEFVGDTIIMFHYPDEADRNENIRVVDAHVLKQRNGPTGIVSLRFNKPATRFEEIT
jgi:replicative DNA helicase